MRQRSQSPDTLAFLITDYGAPVKVKSDNAPELSGAKWTTILRQYAIASEFTEPHHPNENLAERHCGALKAATVHLLHISGAHLSFWCYALEYIASVRAVLAKRSLGWNTPDECHWGERPNLSVFRFIFWEPVWYYNPRQAFPNSKMLKGRFLGIAQNVGDAFCFLILTGSLGGDEDPSSPCCWNTPE